MTQDNEQGRLDSPGETIRRELERRGWGQDDLAKIINRPPPRITGLIQGKIPISPEIAAELAAALGGTAEEWLQREAAYRLLIAAPNVEDVQRRAKLFQLAPVKEIQRRGWVRETSDYDELEASVLKFLEINSLEDEPRISAVMRKTGHGAELTSAQRAWCFRVKQLAKALPVPQFRKDHLQQCERDLHKIAPYSPEVRKVPTILMKYGIRFIVVEPLTGGKLDGTTMWLDDTSPVIGMSLRFDRIDSFWHTLCHEFRHVWHHDMFSADVDLVADSTAVPLDVKPEFERRADIEAAAMMIPQDELESFIKRVGPLYSKTRINQFANRIKVHPGVIVGQLQHRGEIGYSANREMLAKIRDIVTPVALTDGWGTTIDQGALE